MKTGLWSLIFGLWFDDPKSKVAKAGNDISRPTHLEQTANTKSQSPKA
jgi:hypothetical protein